MKAKIMMVIAVLLAVGIGAIIVYLPLKQEKDRLADQIKRSQEVEQSLTKKVEEMNAQQAKQLEEQKKVGLAEKKGGLVYFSQKTTPLPNNQVQIDISLSGEKNTSVDAADLVLSYSPTLTVKEIKKGTVFPSYPRSSDKQGTVTITGLAMPLSNTVTYGKIDEIYATLIIEKRGKGTIEINTKDTQAYFNGTPILDFTSSFKPIAL
ncbi:hypothetical protein HZC27_00150 [Candidatus Roizmanbacteria bacterium]|nr:hypothetical protein [Candidatus Roizmanbacteria bacterium]